MCYITLVTKKQNAKVKVTLRVYRSMEMHEEYFIDYIVDAQCTHRNNLTTLTLKKLNVIR